MFVSLFLTVWLEKILKVNEDADAYHDFWLGDHVCRQSQRSEVYISVLKDSKAESALCVNSESASRCSQ